MELTTPEKTSFQRVDLLLNQQTHRAELQPRRDARLPCSVSAKEQKKPLGYLQNFGFETAETDF
ncbi:TPA: hypothetical protein RQK05_004501 [Vibrio vulnificus]|nr:hypothetical protein [Vibrio vulnificus]HDY7749790.1 hypothetical protein [Vibrio vulnificus]HDY7759166.1 hypothetical protein [Vibrio vulnificus]HDY7763818.1 hypothetical protein [Vibrio vulnificus]HDY7772991.1 hypothetical protein [Vibrio vulnificus]